MRQGLETPREPAGARPRTVLRTLRLALAAAVAAGAVPGLAWGDPAPEAAVLTAAREDQAAGLTAALRAKANVNVRDEAGASPLAWAVLNHNAAMVKQLIGAGADVNLADESGVGPLALALESDQPDLVALLLQSGADPNLGRHGGETPLMTAARVGSVESARLLLARGANVNVRESRFGQTPLMWATGKPDVLRLLLQSGADVHAVTKTWEITATNYTPVTTTLGVTGIPWNNTGDFKVKAGGQNALLFAVQKDDAQSVKMLLDAGVDVNQAAADGATPLIAALYKWRTGGGAKPSALKFSADLALANLLLDRGAKVNVADGAGYTPLHGALLSLLMRQPQGAQPLSFNGTLRSDPDRPRPKPPSDEAAVAAIVQRMLDLGADPNRQTTRQTPGPVNAVRLNPCPTGSSPLHVAVATHSLRLTDLLLQHGGNPNVARADGHTPFTVAVFNNDLALTQTLVAHGADLKRRYDPTDEIADPVEPKTTQRKGQSILHIAAVPGADAVVDFLVAHGADLTARNSLGETPYDLADAQQRFRYSHTIEADRDREVKPEVKRETRMTEALKRAMARRSASARPPKPSSGD